MNTCTVENCTNKHHAKGYCKNHYDKHVLAGNQTICSFPGCTQEIGKAGAKGLCCMHYNRLSRNGDASTVKRTRMYHSFLDEIKGACEGDTYLDFVITNRQHWARVCKKHYGDYCHERGCNWAETSCDVDHITDVSKGGQNTIRNGIVLCPNHHAMKHRPLQKHL